MKKVSNEALAVDEQDKPRYHVPALEKGLDILEHLSRLAVPQTQVELSRALGRNISEIFRMLETLEQRGYLLRDDAGRYQLSLKLFELAHTHSPLEQLLQVTRTPMRELAKELHESVHMGVLRDGQLFIIAQEESPEPIRISVEVGRKYPAIKTASGRLMLAHSDLQTRQTFFATDPDFLMLSGKRQKELKKRLEEARINRYVIAPSDLIVGVRDTSVLIGHPDLGVMATLAVPVLMSRVHEVNVPKILAALQNRASEITQTLGLSQ
jgi:DNA-binding IclR family transcriptional regulator